MRNILFLTTSLVFISFSAQAGLEDTPTPDCASLGYKTDVTACLAEQGIPLVCPFANASAPKCICIKDSCRGYNLSEDGYYEDEISLSSKASDGRSISEHILSYDECTVGTGTEARTLYKVRECKEGSLYQNGKCR